MASAACSSTSAEDPSNDAEKPGETPGETAATDGGAADSAAPKADRSVRGSWQAVTIAPPDGAPIEPVFHVIVRGDDDIYVSEGASNLGTGFYHYDGSDWSSTRVPDLNTGFALLGDGELLAFGTDILKLANGRWSRQLAAPEQRFVGSLAGASLDSFFLTAGDVAYEVNGRSARAIATLPEEGSFARATDGALAYLGFDNDGNALLRQVEGKWSRAEMAEPYVSYGGARSLFGSAADDYWFVGNDYDLVHFDGESFARVPGPDDEWGCKLAVGFATSKKNAWLGGEDGCLFHWDGAAWSKVDSGVEQTISAVHGSSPENVWLAFGSETEVLRLVPEEP